MTSDAQRVRCALHFIPAHDRDTWLRMAMAVKSELGDAGFDVWDEWSQQADSYRPADAKAVWRSVRTNGQVTVGSLFHEAKQNGWPDDPTRRLPTPDEVVERQRATAERAALEEQIIAQQRAETAEKSVAIWKAATPARADHPYLVRKLVQPVPTLREIGIVTATSMLGYSPRTRHGEPLVGRLLVVPVKVLNAMSTLELIDDTGRKHALRGGAKAGGYWAAQPLPEGDGAGSTLLMGEGVATVLSTKQATDHHVVAALTCGNLVSVAETMRARYPAARLVVLADLLKNTGEPDPHAIKAAHAVDGFVANPEFGTNRPEGATDFNDLARLVGAEAVKRAVADAKAPEVSTHETGIASATGADSGGPPWPDAMDEAAMHGIAGEFVRMVEPDTEADPVAILLQFLVFFGSLVGRGPHYRVEGDQHYVNLYLLLVGATSKARKGTSKGRVCQPFELIRSDDALASWKPYVSGLSSGEGLKSNVRDATTGVKKTKAGESVTEITDEGVSDKRLLVIESEFASALRSMQRPGNTLSATVREGWDTGNLRTLTKNDPIIATSAHISIIGHITADELRAELAATDSANGFANRFLFVAVKRSKFLPFGGDQADEGELHALSDRLRERADLARTRTRVTMTSNARTAWAKVYPELSAGSEGLHGAVTARAEAQVIRLALIYCLLDGCDQIDVPHLLAALAVWQYCDATAKHIFGTSLGDQIADEIMRRLKLAGDAGLTRTDIRDLFGRNLSADKIGAALDLLRRKGKATCENVKTEGRPSETWKAAK